jgi:hypothetical protein
MIGSGPSANSERSLVSHKTGIVLSSSAAVLETGIQIQHAENSKEKLMSILIILAIMAGVLLAAAVAHTQRSGKNKEPMQLGVGSKLRP